MRYHNSLTEEKLNERIKELKCLYRISEVVDYFGDDLDAIMRAVVEIIPGSMRYSDSTGVILRLDKQTYSSGNIQAPCGEYGVDLGSREDSIGRLTVFYNKDFPPEYAGPFLFEETQLINAVAERIGKIYTRIHAQQNLALAEEATRNMNITLREILQRLEHEKDEIHRQIQKNIDQVILPTVEYLSSSLGTTQYGPSVSLLRANLEEIASEFISRLQRQSDSLTLREVQICDMIRHGMSSKEIAAALSIAASTVHNHREHIRRKLDIRNREINLATYLKNSI